MDDLVKWLRAQLDDEERAARAWLPLGNPTAADREHIARHDPARVLAEVDAKRRILDEYAECLRKGDEYDDRAVGYRLGLETAVQTLALPYAEREGYRQEWAPYFYYGRKTGQ